MVPTQHPRGDTVTTTEAPAWMPREEEMAPNGNGPVTYLSDVGALVALSANRAALGGVVLDAPELVESIWGDNHRCLWAKGEPFLLCGPDGVGKTALAEQLALHLCGV